MGYAPLVNWRNFTVPNLKSILEVYPDMLKSVTQREAYDIIEDNLGGYKKTAYQFACQLGLEDKSKEIFEIQNYLYSFDDNNLKKYLEFWFKIYYAPNPFVKSDDESIIIYKEIAESVLNSSDNEINFTEFFNNKIGGPRPDILVNCIEALGNPLKIKRRDSNIYVYIDTKDKGMLKTQIDLTNQFPMPKDKKDRHLFFERYSYENFCKFPSFPFFSEKII